MMERNNSLSGENDSQEANSRKIDKKNWCGGLIRNDKVFNDPDNLAKSSIQNSNTFDGIIGNNDSLLRKLRRLVDVSSNQIDNLKCDKCLSPTRTPNVFYDSSRDPKSKMKFPKIINCRNGNSKTICISICEDKYMLETKQFQRIGDIRKTISLWIDMRPDKIIIENKFCCLDEENIWAAADKGGMECNVKFGKKCVHLDDYKIILFKPKKVIFRENVLNFQMLFHEGLKFRTIKKIILLKLKKNNCWIKFFINEKIYNDESKLFELPISTDLVKMQIFEIRGKKFDF
jgi:hypothetical protein